MRLFCVHTYDGSETVERINFPLYRYTHLILKVLLMINNMPSIWHMLTYLPG